MIIEIKTFETMNVKELYEALKLRSDVFVVEQTCIYADLDGRDENASHVMVQENGRVIGYLRILDKGQTFDEIAIGRVVVDPAFRKRGIAEEMMKTAIAYIKENLGASRIKLAAQQYLTGFYEGLGFRVISEGYVEDGIPHVDMEYKG